MVKQPNLKLEPVACVYFKVIGAWWTSAHPWGVGDRVCIVKQVGVRFAGNLALISSTRPRTHPSLARVPEGLIRSYGRRSTGYQMLIMRSRMLTYPPSQPLFALVTQRSLSNAWRDKTMASKETTVCVNQCSLGKINYGVHLLQINWKFSLSPPLSPSLSLTHDISRVIRNLQVVYRKSYSLISYVYSHLLDM